MARRESRRIRAKTEKAIANRERERVESVHDLPKVGSRIEVWLALDGVRVWWGAKVVRLEIPDEYPVCAGKPNVGDSVDVDTGNGIHVPAVVESIGREGEPDLMMTLKDQRKSFEIGEIVSWRFSKRKYPSFDDKSVATARLLYDAMPGKGYPCAEYGEVCFKFGRMVTFSGKQLTTWRDCNGSYTPFCDQAMDGGGPCESSSDEDIKQRRKIMKSDRRNEDLLRRVEEMEKSFLSRGKYVQNTKVEHGQVGAIDQSESSDTLGVVILTMLRRSVEKAVEQVFRSNAHTSTGTFSHSEVDGAMACAVAVTTPIYIPASQCGAIFREMLKESAPHYEEGRYEVHPYLGSAVQATGLQNVSIRCSSFAVISDLLRMSPEKRIDLMVYRKGFHMEGRVNKVSGNNRDQSGRYVSLYVLGAALCERSTKGSSDTLYSGEQMSFGIGHSSLCGFQKSQFLHYLSRESSMKAQGQFVSKMELRHARSECSTLSHNVSTKLNGEREVEINGKEEKRQKFSIEWVPMPQTRRGPNRDGNWGSLKVYIPYVVLRGVEEPIRVSNLLTTELLESVVGGYLLQKHYERYLR